MWRFLKACALALILVLGLFALSAAWELAAFDPYNQFARAYNDFIEAQNRGVMDLRKLHRMRAAWRELEKSAGWPEEKH